VEFGEEFKRQQEKLGQFQRVEILSLNDKDAAKSKIIESINQLAAKVQPEDAVIVYFAGHGTAAKDRFYLIPHDLGYAGPHKQLDRTAIRLGHGYLTYALVEEGLKKGAADHEPQDKQIVLREWLNYASRRVPEMQLEIMNAAPSGQTRILEQEEITFVEGEEKIHDPKRRSIQRPRAFFRRELETQPFIVWRP
jgi:hypothetical protein